MPSRVRIDVVPLPNGSQAMPKRGPKSRFGAFTTALPYGEAPGTQPLGAVATFCELTIMPLQKFPVPTTRLPAPVTCGADAGLKTEGSKFDKRPFLSYGAPKYE